MTIPTVNISCASEEKRTGLTESDAFKGKGGRANHHGKVGGIDRFDIGSNTIQVETVGRKVDDTDQTKKNKDIGDHGTEGEASNMSDHDKRTDYHERHPDVVSLFDVGSTVREDIDDT